MHHCGADHRRPTLYGYVESRIEKSRLQAYRTAGETS